MSKRPTTSRVLVIQPGDDDPLGRFDGWLADHGTAVQVVRPYDGDLVPDRLAADGLIVLGGEMSANDDARHPWMVPVRALFRDAVAQEAPTLGICLGAQLLAQALGGTVVRGRYGVEAGLVTVTSKVDATGDPLFDGLGADFPVASMHGDVVDTLPPGAVLVGTGSTYPHQAFRAAATAWGVQFHPEISPSTYTAWTEEFHSSDPAEAARVRRGIGDLTAADDAVRRIAAELAGRFATLVNARAGAAPADRSGRTSVN